MHVLSGTKKGHKIITPNTKFRPTQSKVRDAFFNAVKIEGKTFLDLCAGSGAMGLEALSRGAKHATSIDIDILAIKSMYANYKKIFDGQESHYIIKKISSDDFVKRTKENYDAIFIDPPYFATVYEKIIKTIFERNILNENGVVVSEISTEFYNKASFYQNYEHTVRKYGTTILVFMNDNACSNNNSTDDNDNSHDKISDCSDRDNNNSLNNN